MTTVNTTIPISTKMLADAARVDNSYLVRLIKEHRELIFGDGTLYSKIIEGQTVVALRPLQALLLSSLMKSNADTRPVKAAIAKAFTAKKAKLGIKTNLHNLTEAREEKNREMAKYAEAAKPRTRRLPAAAVCR